MPEYNNPIEKYNAQDRKISGFLKATGRVFDYVYYILGGLGVAAILWLVTDAAPVYVFLIGGCVAGAFFAKANIWFREQFSDDAVSLLVPALLLCCLIGLVALYIFYT